MRAFGRGVVALARDEEFLGRRWSGTYNHAHSEPTIVGPFLWRQYHDIYEGDLEAMAETLIYDAPAGWRSIADNDRFGEPRREHWTEREVAFLDERHWYVYVLARDALLVRYNGVTFVARWAEPEPDWDRVPLFERGSLLRL